MNKSPLEVRGVYEFPGYHRIGEMVRPIVTSRYWIVFVLVVVILWYLPFLFSGFSLDDYMHRLRFSAAAYEKLNLPAAADPRGPLTLYSFVQDGSLQYSRDKGLVPWWASDHIKANFFRPLSSLTLALDFSLWPDTPLLPHIHSLLWYCLLILLVHRLYGSLSGNAMLAGIGILFFAVDDVFIYPAGWISNRHALIAMVFCVLTIQMFHLAVRQRNRTSLAVAAGTYALALLASEMGLVTLLYLFAYLVVLAGQRWTGRILSFIPFLLITGVWWLAYAALEYGTQANLLYLDPIHSPMQFIAQLLTRFPIYIFSSAGPPVAGTLLGASPQAAAWIAAGCSILLGLLALTVLPVLRQDRTSIFWTIGLLAAAVPLTAGIPGERNLGLVSLGVMGLMAQLVASVAAMKHPTILSASQLGRLKILVPVLLLIHLFVPLHSAARALDSMQVGREWNDKLVDFGSDPALAEQHLYVINPPGTLFYRHGIFQRLFTDAPVPASINYLSSGYAPVQIERVGVRTIIVTPAGGYSPQPGPILDDKTGELSQIGQENLVRLADGLIYNPRYPLQTGQVIALSEMTVQVRRMTGDGRVAQAAFTFAGELEDSRYVWLLWDANTSTYVEVRMPPVGESRVYSDEFGAFLCASFGCP